MQEAIPSRTALRVALRRAAHQTIDDPVVFRDPLAVSILGSNVDQMRAPERDSSRTLRAFLVARSRYAEDTLALGIANGITQYVLLGAGLDTFAYRNTNEALSVYEVDHPATQAWKLGLLEESGIAIPGNVTHVPVDFEHQTLATQLQNCGFRSDRSTFFGWLGVVPYLTEPAFDATLHFITQQAPGSGFVFDYARPPESLALLERMAFQSMAERVARAGEPFRLFFEPEALAERLHAAGFEALENLNSKAINERYFSERSDGLSVLGGAGNIVSAWLPSRNA